MNHEELKRQALAKESVRAIYDSLEAEFALLHSMLDARRQAGMTQADVAARMGTQPSAVTRLEGSLSSGKHSPSLETLRRYAEAVGGRLEVRIVVC